MPLSEDVIFLVSYYALLLFGFDEEGLLLHHRDAATCEVGCHCLIFSVGEKFVLGYLLGGTDMTGQELFDELQCACPCEPLESFELWGAGAEPDGAMHHIETLFL